MILIATKTVLNSDSVPLSINLEDSDIRFAKTVRNLGVCLDPTLSFQQQISSVCRICYLELRRISAIRHYLSEDVTKKLLCAFVLSRLDYCNSFLAGCPKYLLSKLQKVKNNAARLNLSELLHLYTPSRQLRSSTDTRVFRIPSFRTKSCGQRHSTSVSSFKSSLKTFLFLKTFSSVSLP